ncbi:WD40/YVTN/BNR-like repeat-containing protein [Litoribrevibacter albus]|uniref:Photosynthesis system II assembly factor Ycf48/Hcf136-like domain-containing protein n=1 Tax=Litoribrevibacter albus TaxID=1473156 RepID=A0AA37W6V9_9GAMM|nr:YCF48-related protein [Litoribrevibacter albus]GLQ32322.1 hypothetical protein GCM10007876_28010 [Litoribrevibacter albus]
MVKTVKTRALKSLLLPLVAASGFSLSQQALSFSDVLDTPAVKSPKAAESLLLDVDKLSGGRLVAAGERGHILYSDDNGKSWVQADVPVIVNIISAHFVNDSIGWAVGHDGVVLKTTNGGQSWIRQFDGFKANEQTLVQRQKFVEELEAQIEEASDSKLEELELALEEAQFALEDAQFDVEGGSTKPFLDVWFKDENYGLVVGAYGQMFQTTDGGTTWHNVADKLDNPDRFHLNSIEQTQPGALVVVGEAGLIMRSTDNGDSWETLDSPYDGSFFGAVSTRQLNGLLVYGLRGHVFRSSDLGDTWEQIEVNTEQTLNSGSAFKDGTIMLVGNNGVVLKSYDSGRNFTATVREDRSSLVGITESNDGGIVLVGQDGLYLALPNAE